MHPGVFLPRFLMRAGSHSSERTEGGRLMLDVLAMVAAGAAFAGAVGYAFLCERL